MKHLIDVYNQGPNFRLVNYAHPPNPIHGKWLVEVPDTDREDLAALFDHLGFRYGVEVGTQNGEFAEILCVNNPTLQLDCIDPWEPYEGYDQVDGQKDSFIAAQDRLKGTGATLFQGYSPDEAVRYEDESLDFVYVDGNHEFLAVTKDLAAWYPKIRVGGIMSGHDWIRDTNIRNHMHVIEAVQGFTWAYNIRPVYILGSKREVPGQKREKHRSWFWIKDRPCLKFPSRWCRTTRLLHERAR